MSEKNGYPEHDVSMPDDELAIEPAADDAIGIRLVVRDVEGVELELRLDAVPFVVVKDGLFGVVEFAVVAALEGALREPVGHVFVLHVRGAEAKPAIHRLDVKLSLKRTALAFDSSPIAFQRNTAEVAVATQMTNATFDIMVTDSDGELLK